MVHFEDHCKTGERSLGGGNEWRFGLFVTWFRGENRNSPRSDVSVMSHIVIDQDLSMFGRMFRLYHRSLWMDRDWLD